MRIRTHANPFHYTQRMEPVSWPTIFGMSPESLEFEAGFGRGLFLNSYATLHPDRFIVGVEVRKQAVDIFLERLAKDPKPNLYAIHGNAQIALEDLIPDGSLKRVFVFHPDPWFKKRHHKRRLINSHFLKTLSTKMKPDGVLYLSTDVNVLWEAMRETLLEEDWEEVQDPEFWQNEYRTNWQEWSVQDRRTAHMGCFQWKKKAKSEKI